MSYSKESTYVSKPLDANGNADYTQEEDSVWHDLMARQQKIVVDRACDEYIHGLKLLNLPRDRVPQCYEVTKVLQETTGWALEPVPALIPFEQFFTLLAKEFSQNAEELTTTLKIKRSVVAEHFQDAINRMYRETENQDEGRNRLFYVL